MPQIQGARKRTQGLISPIIELNPASFIDMKRAPTTNDHAEQSTIWVYSETPAGVAVNEVYINGGKINGADQWLQLESSGGTGNFTTLTSTGQFNLDTTAVGVNTLGNTTGATSITSSVGTGGYTVDGVGASNYAFGASTTTGTFSIGGTAQTGTITLGSSSGTNIVNIAAGAGASTVNIANAQVAGAVSIGAAMTTGDIDIGGSQTTGHILIGNGAAMTGQITLGNSTGIQTIVVGAGSTGAKTIQIGSGTAGNQIQIGQGINTVAQVVGISTGASAADSTVNILTGTATAGTSTLNLATGAYAHAINVGTGAAVVNTIAVGGTGANVITVGNTQTAGSISLGAAMTTGTINIGSNLSGLVTMPFVSVSAAGTTVVNNVRVGQAIYTGNTDAAGATTVYTLTNSLIAATSSIFLTVSNLGSNDAQMTITRLLPGAGTLAISLKNNGAAALNGDIQVSFWVN